MMRKHFFVCLSLLAVLIGCFSCKPNSTTMLPGISGASGEVLIVIEKSRWEGEIGQALRELFQEELTFLPQPEDMFSFIQISPEQFAPVFQSHRTLIIVKLSTELTESKITVRNNVWASPQLVLEMNGPDQASLASYIRESADEIQEKINGSEQARLIATYTRYKDKKISDLLRDKYHISMAIPMGYKVDFDTAGFVSISNDTPDATLGILVYHYPYSDTNTFTPDYLILKRNQVTRKYIEGPTAGSWMSVERLLEPEFTEFSVEGRYYASLKGLWMLERGSGGGPFVNLSTVDEARNRVIGLDGYVYAPGQEKRELRRQVDAIIHSLKILE